MTRKASARFRPSGWCSTETTGTLRFSPERARWVSLEQWHPAQQGLWLDDGCYELRVPYHDARELVMDILRHGSEVEVIGPPPLRDKVISQLREAIHRYA